MAKITGLGGIFYVVKDPKATRAWYRDILGIGGDYGPHLNWSEDSSENPYSLISHFSDSAYIKPSNAEFMINLRTDDVNAFVEQLKEKNIEILGQVDEGYGKFAWIMDPNGIKIELWEQLAIPE